MPECRFKDKCDKGPHLQICKDDESARKFCSIYKLMSLRETECNLPLYGEERGSFKNQPPYSTFNIE